MPGHSVGRDRLFFLIVRRSELTMRTRRTILWARMIPRASLRPNAAAPVELIVVATKDSLDYYASLSQCSPDT